MKTFFLYFLVLLLPLSVFAWKEFSVETPVEYIVADALQNIWVLNGNMISKYDSLGNKILSVKFVQEGKANGIDVRDPMAPCFFYFQNNKIIITDKNLTLTNSIDFQDIYPNPVLLGARSNDGNFWILNSSDLRISKISHQKKILISTNSLLEAGLRSVRPMKLIESNPYLYFLNKGVGVLVYDIYGNYLKTLEYPNAKDIYVVNDNLFLTLKDKIVQVSVSSFQETVVNLQINTDDFIHYQPLSNNFWLMGGNKGFKVIKN